MTQPKKTLLFAASIGNLIESYDIFICSYLSYYLALHFFPENQTTQALMGTFSVFLLSMLARPIGALLFGYLGDNKGRKPAFVLAIFLMAIATLVIVAIPSFDSIGFYATIAFLAARVLQSISVGGEYMGAIIYATESAPSNKRGFWGSLVMLGANLGTLFASFFCWILTCAFAEEAIVTWAWRIPFLLSFLGTLIGFYIRRNLAESPEFINQKNLRQKQSLPQLLHKQQTVMMKQFSLSAFGLVTTYLLFSYMTTHLVNYFHYTMFHALLLNNIALLCLVMIIPFGGWFGDKIGLHKVMLCGIIGISIFIFPYFFFISTNSLGGIFFSQCLLAVFAGLYFSVTPTYISSLAPIHSRTTTTSLGYNLAAGLIGGSTPILALFSVNFFNSSIAPAFLIIIWALIAFVVIKFCPLSQLSEENLGTAG